MVDIEIGTGLEHIRFGKVNRPETTSLCPWLVVYQKCDNEEGENKQEKVVATFLKPDDADEYIDSVLSMAGVFTRMNKTVTLEIYLDHVFLKEEAKVG